MLMALRSTYLHAVKMERVQYSTIHILAAKQQFRAEVLMSNINDYNTSTCISPTQEAFHSEHCLRVSLPQYESARSRQDWPEEARTSRTCLQGS